MSNSTLPVVAKNRLPATTEAHQFVSITIGKQSFGIPVLLVHDVLGPQRITRIPLAPKEVAGSLNLRGRIVTAIQVRQIGRASGRERVCQDVEIWVVAG